MFHFKQLKKLFAFGAIFATGFLLAAHSSYSDLGSLREAVAQSWQVLSDADVPNETKSLQIDALFRELTQECQSNCPAVISLLKNANSKLGSLSADAIISQIPGEIGKHLTLNPKDLQNALVKLDSVISRVDPKMLSYRIQATSELLRYLVSIEEKNIFELARSAPGSAQKQAALTQIQQDVAQFRKQLRAIWDLFQFLKDESNYGEKAIDAQKVIKDIDDLGIFYMKLAQSLSNFQVLPKQLTESLRKYQDDVKQMPPEEVEAQILAEFGKPSREIFIDFDASRPLKSGTVAQTYIAKIKTLFGPKEVIVKVQRPGLEKQLNWNRQVNRSLLKAGQVLLSDRLQWVMDLLSGSVSGLEDAFESELDFRIEAKNLIRFRRQFSFVKNVTVPKVYLNYSGRRVLTMEKLSGQNVERLLDAARTNEEKLSLITRKRLFIRTLDSFLYQTVIMGELHADMHPGNVLATDGARLGLIDMAQTFRTRGLISAPARLFFSVFRGDSEGIEKAMRELGRFASDQKPAFEPEIQRILNENNMTRLGYKAVLSGDFTNERLEKITDVIQAVFKSAVMSHDYKAHASYLQFFRSAAPVGSTLYQIAKTIPEKDLKSMMVWEALTLGPKAIYGYLNSRAMGAFDRIESGSRETARCLAHAFEE